MGLLRYILSISVIATHQPLAFLPSLVPGEMAVEMFFIISGFYMSFILSTKYNYAKNASAILFYKSRYIRLWPLFALTTFTKIAILIAAAAFSIGSVSSGSVSIMKSVNSGIFIAAASLSNISMIGQDLPCLVHYDPVGGIFHYFGPAGNTPDGSIWIGYTLLIGQAWSIGSEIWFYILAPFLVKRSSLVLVLLTLMSFLIRMSMSSYNLNSYFFFPCQFGLFLVGMLGYRLKDLHQRFDVFGKVNYSIMYWVFIISLVWVSNLSTSNFALKWVLYGLIAFIIFPIFENSRYSKSGRILGELSYPIYITQGLVITLCAAAVGRNHLSGEFIIVVTTALSVILYCLVEMPIDRWRQRFVASSFSAADRQTGSVGLPKHLVSAPGRPLA